MMCLYDSIGKLLEDISDPSKNHKTIAKKLRVSKNTYENWLKGEPIGAGNIDSVARITSIPLEVLFRLNYGYPTYYAIKTKRYALCPFDKSFVRRKVIQERLLNTDVQGDILELIRWNNFIRLNELDKTSVIRYGINVETVKAAAKALPELNVIVFDPFIPNISRSKIEKVNKSEQLVTGYLLCYPVSLQTYNKLKEGRIDEQDITPEQIITPGEEPFCFHFYRFFSTYQTYSYFLAKSFVEYLINHEIHPDTVLSMYAATNDGIELCRKFDLEWRFTDFKARKVHGLEVNPQFFSKQILQLRWINKYKGRELSKE